MGREAEAREVAEEVVVAKVLARVLAKVVKVARARDGDGAEIMVTELKKLLQIQMRTWCGEGALLFDFIIACASVEVGQRTVQLCVGTSWRRSIRECHIPWSHLNINQID